jgi:molecular chaperone HtpG
MPVKQKEIYALVAPDPESAARAPHLEAFRAKGFEVLFWTDPIDEFVLQRFTSFEERPIRRIDRGDAPLLEEGEKAERAARSMELAPLFEAIRKELAGDVAEVRASSRLTESPVCLVAGEHALSPQLVRALRDAGQAVPEEKRVLELNPTHPLTARLAELLEKDPGRFAGEVQLLLDLARVAEGSPPADPARFARRVSELLAGGS